MGPKYIALIVYTSAILPLLIMLIMAVLGKVPKWVWQTYILSVLLAAFGWEIWFTFGIFDGQSVDIRRPELLNQLIPQSVNWLLNSLADGGIVVNGILYVWLFSRNKERYFFEMELEGIHHFSNFLFCTKLDSRNVYLSGSIGCWISTLMGSFGTYWTLV